MFKKCLKMFKNVILENCLFIKNNYYYVMVLLLVIELLITVVSYI